MLLRRRYQLFEFTDQSWFTGILREGFLDCLDFIHRFFRPYRSIGGILKNCAHQTSAVEFLDLCSGSAQHLFDILSTSKGSKESFPMIVASDLYPQVARYRRLEMLFGADRFRYEENSVSLHSTPLSYRNLSLFTALHHFTQQQIYDFFLDVVHNRDCIVIAEFTQRRYLNLLNALLITPLYLLAPFFSSTFRFSKIFLGTILPVVPLIVMFDSIVSNLRSYTNAEIETLFRRALDAYAATTGKDVPQFEITSNTYPFAPFANCVYFCAVRLSVATTPNQVDS